MKNALCKNEVAGKPVVFKGHTVITTELLSQVYETDVNNIQTNFARNKDKFEEGKHYILLQGNELKGFKNHPTNSQLVNKHASQLYLWTERGASRHCKILDTDKAWEQFDYLEDTYFVAKENTINPLDGTSTELQAILMHDKKIVVIENRLANLEDNIHISRAQQRKINQFAKEVVIKALGSKYSNAYKELKARAFSEFWKHYQAHFNISSYLDTPKKEFQNALHFINVWVPSKQLQYMIVGANTQMTI